MSEINEKDYHLLMYFAKGGKDPVEDCERLWNTTYLQKEIDGYSIVPQRMEELKVLSVPSKPSKRNFEALANRIRELYPKGYKPGTTYTWRDSTRIIAVRLEKFIELFGNYSDDEIFKATQKYVQSFNGDYQYMQLLKYFILKDIKTIDARSELAALLENPDADNDQQYGDWTTQIDYTSWNNQ